VEKIIFMREGDYLLVTDSEKEDGEALIMRDMSSMEEEEAVYEIVTDYE